MFHKANSSNPHGRVVKVVMTMSFIPLMLILQKAKMICLSLKKFFLIPLIQLHILTLPKNLPSPGVSMFFDGSRIFRMILEMIST